jgi:hypothetical protein
MIRTLITRYSEPLAPEAVAQLIADFKLRNPHLCDDAEDACQDMATSPIGQGELRPEDYRE